MAENKPATIRYSYRHDDLPRSAIRHVFNYISAVSGQIFIEDRDNPEIWKDDGNTIPVSARIIIKKENDRIWIVYARDANSSNTFLKIDYDLIAKIIKKLSLSAKCGPYSQEHLMPSPSIEPTMSKNINDFIQLLSDAGINAKGARGIALWPNAYKFGLVVSHDIDIAHRSVLGGVRILFKNALPGGIPAIVDSLNASIGLRSNPYDGIPEWLKLEKEMGIKSTYFIFAGKRIHANDPRYRLEKLAKSIDLIKSYGHEIALHTSIGSFNGEQIVESKSQLEKFCDIKIMGLRPHYLSAFYPEYWQKALAAGFEYSSSLGFDDNIGFINGLDLPFYPYDDAGEKPIKLLEIPIGIMDCGLIGNNNANSQDVFDKGKALIDRTAANGGLMVLDWHQRTYYNRDYPGWLGLFLRIVQYAKEAGAYITDMGELVRIMKSRFGS
jgi:peptidoglycan/xylan/chitin deacetylase (PgdA/CDA1 family)